MELSKEDIEEFLSRNPDYTNKAPKEIARGIVIEAINNTIWLTEDLKNNLLENVRSYEF